MSKNVAVFVDVANLYYAARGQDVDVDYVALLKHATKGRDLIRAYAYSGLDPENENQKKFLEFLSKNGYKVVAKDIRKFGDGRVKANLDIELVVDLFRLADRMDVAVIVSGDGDFAPAIRALQDEGVRCEVISFKPNTSSDLFAVADEFVDAMKISAISRQKDTKGVGAPEMPAKEVNPDVGFREASPSVAAAAIAAIRLDGEDGGAGRGRGRAAGGRRPDRTSRPARGTRSRTTEREPIAITESSTVADATPAAARAESGDESAAEGARRRRRRGGRGRGRRGRRGDIPEATSAASDAEPAEISWQELDSLEELEGLGVETTRPEREFEFEEADAGTLAELGLSGQPEAGETPSAAAATMGAEADATAAPASPSKSRSRKPSTRATSKSASKSASKVASESAPESTSKAAAKPRARSTAKAGTKATASSRGAGSGVKPRAARTSRSKASDAPAAESDQGSDEGIWKRFTSGRGSRKRTTPEPPEAA